MAELASRTRTNDGGLLTGTYDLTAARTRVASRAAASSRRGEVAWLRGVRCNESMRPNGSRRRANVGNGARHPGKARRRARSLFPLPAPDDSQSFPFESRPPSYATKLSIIAAEPAIIIASRLPRAARERNNVSPWLRIAAPHPAPPSIMSAKKPPSAHSVLRAKA